MAARIFTLKFQNTTDRPWHFAVYQKFNADHKISSVAWQVIRLAPQLGCSPPTEDQLSWKQNYGVCTVDYDKERQKYLTNQLVPAKVGRHYHVVSSNHIPIISEEFEEEMSHHHNIIVFQNKTNDPVRSLSMGFAMDNKLIAAEQDVGGQMKMSYTANLTYYIACYHHIEVGQLVDEGVTIGPIKIDYESENCTHTIRIHKDYSGKYLLQHYRNETLEEPDNSNTLEKYKLVLQNVTDKYLFFGIYQSLPYFGLTSVAWQVCGLPPSVSDVSTTYQVKWSMDFGICTAEVDKDEQKYVGIQFVPADLNNTYEVVSVEGIPGISTIPTRSRKADQQIVVENNTGLPAIPLTIGFTIENKIVAIAKHLESGQKTMYEFKPSYFAACYHNLIPGQLVDEGVVIGPVKVQYDRGAYTATVKVLKDEGGNYQMKVT